MQDPRTPPAVDLDPESLNAMSRHFWNSAILRAGLKLGLFTMLEQRAALPGDLAKEIGADHRFLHAFLEVSVALELLEKDGGLYRNSAAASSFLVPGKPRYVGDLILHITNHWIGWGSLDQLVKEGRTLLPFESGFVDAETYWTDYMMGQHNRATAGQGDQLVEHVDLTSRRRMLDLGGGAASYSLALCAANPELHSVVVDQKEPMAVARGLVKEHGLGERVSFMEGDFLQLDLRRDYDVVLISGVVLIKSEEVCRHLLRLAYDVLQPGGLVIVKDFMRIDHSPQRSFMDTLMDLYVLIAFDPEAGDRFGAEIAGWLQGAGFANPSLVPLPTHLALVLAEKAV